MRIIHDLKIDKSLIRLWLVLLAFSVGSLVDVAEYAARGAGAVGALAGLACVAVLKATALACGYALCRRNVWLKAFAIAVIVVFAVLSTLNGVCWIFYGFGISMKLMKIILETNPTEVGEFMPELEDKLLATFRSPWLWVCLCAFAIAWKWLPKVRNRILAGVWIAMSALGAGYLTYVFASAEFGRTNHVIFARSGRCVAKYIRDRQRVKELQSLKRPFPYAESLISRKAAEHIVVVIGESASRNHLSIYGYPLPTTPRLDSIRNDLYIFEDAVASSTSTSENMPRLLTMMTDDPSGREWYEFPSILQIFGQTGYRTYWLSNQEYSGDWSNLSSIIAADADVIEYVGNMDSEDHYLSRYDDALLPKWRDALAANDSLQLTFLHLMGSHFQYDRRYPASQARFSSKDIMDKMPRKWLNNDKASVIANYDNSILFTDSILGCVIDGVRSMKQPAVLIYLSDHGEDVYEDRDYRGRDPKFVEVPMVIYPNGAYRNNNPEIIKAIESALRKPFSTSELPQMLLHLTGTDYRMYDSVRDPLSVGFMPRKRWVDEEVYYKDWHQ